MSRWDTRLDRLADRIGGGDGCPGCGRGSEGPVVVTSTAWGDPKPEPCGTCGAEPFTFTLKLDNPNDVGTGSTPYQRAHRQARLCHLNNDRR